MATDHHRHRRRLGRRSVSAAAIAVAATAGTACSSAVTPDATITLVDYAITAPSTLPSGTSVLAVDVQGVAHHTLTICPSTTIGACEGDLIVQRLVERPVDARDQSLIPDETRQLVLGAGWQATIEVDLPTGSYRIYCQIVNHAGYGMDRLIEVRPGA